MNAVRPDEDPRERSKDFPEEVEAKAQRKLKAQADKNRSVWFGFGMFGLVGWAVAIPTLAGIALGVWIDATWPGPISWTITGLFIGVVLGCLNAWYWVKKESRRHN